MVSQPIRQLLCDLRDLESQTVSHWYGHQLQYWSLSLTTEWRICIQFSNVIRSYTLQSTLLDYIIIITIIISLSFLRTIVTLCFVFFLVSISRIFRVLDPTIYLDRFLDSCCGLPHVWVLLFHSLFALGANMTDGTLLCTCRLWFSEIFAESRLLKVLWAELLDDLCQYDISFSFALFVISFSMSSLSINSAQPPTSINLFPESSSSWLWKKAVKSSVVDV